MGRAVLTAVILTIVSDHSLRISPKGAEQPFDAVGGTVLITL